MIVIIMNKVNKVVYIINNGYCLVIYQYNNIY